VALVGGAKGPLVLPEIDTSDIRVVAVAESVFQNKLTFFVNFAATLQDHILRSPGAVISFK
jgi:hypothetical protein